MIDKSQFPIDGVALSRIKYGDEADDWGASQQPCSSCGVSHGEFYQAGCFVERCPKCQGQVVSCRCVYDETFTRHPMSNLRRAFYKLFWLAMIPGGLIALLLSFNPLGLSAGIRLATILAIAVLLPLLFGSKLGEVESHQVIVKLKDESS